MRRLWKIFSYAISATVIAVTLYLSNIPVAAKEYDQSYLPLSGSRTLSPREYLYVSAGADARVLDKLISCESGWKADIRNKSSTATGLAQFLNSTWVYTRKRMGLSTDLQSRIDPYEHIDALIYLWDGGRGASNWLESSKCWQPYL